MAGLAVSAGWVGSGGCTNDIRVLDLPAADAGSPPPFDGSVGTMTDFCAGSGPPPLVDSSPGGASMCASVFGKNAFSFALCSCGDVTSAGGITSDVVAGQAADTGGVGVNGNLHAGNIDVQGPLDVFGLGDLTPAGPTALSVAGYLRAQGTVRDFTSVTVVGDAWLTSGISTAGSLDVTGTLHVPVGEPRTVSSEMYGATDNQTFSGGQPCDCSGAAFLSVPGVVSTYATNNDNGTLAADLPDGSAPDKLLEEVSGPVTQTFGCGRYYFDSITSGGPRIHLTASGRVAFFVNGDLSTSDFIVDTPDGAQFDLFVAGAVTVGGVFQLGDAAHPGAARLYVGKSVDFENTATFGYLYAPGGKLNIGGQQATAYGAIFAGSLNAGADLALHYDAPSLSSWACP